VCARILPDAQPRQRAVSRTPTAAVLTRVTNTRHAPRAGMREISCQAVYLDVCCRTSQS
jgi:hypothetical protein